MTIRLRRNPYGYHGYSYKHFLIEPSRSDNNSRSERGWRIYPDPLGQDSSRFYGTLQEVREALAATQGPLDIPHLRCPE